MAKKLVNKRSAKPANAQLKAKTDKFSASQTSKHSKRSIENNLKTKKIPYSYEIGNGAGGYRPIVVTALAVLFGFLNSYHQATMFENDRHFSHLSSLEREMTFRTEMGLYYYYFKVLTEAPSLWSGMSRIMNDNLTEYPSIINTLERFNLYPEVIMATTYRNLLSFTNYFNISIKDCWQVLRGDLDPIESCEGIGDPAYFYTTFVFLLNGLVGSCIFLYGTFLSNSILGGLLSAVSFFFNHGECTRVQWTPPLRESFGYPVFLLQMLFVTLTLRSQRMLFSHSVIIAVVNTLFMISWQFAQFALLTQVLVVFTIYVLNFTRADILKCILKGHMMALFASVFLLFGNKMLIASFYTSTLAICYLIAVQENQFHMLKHTLQRMIAQGITFIVGCALVKMVLSSILNVTDDAHIWNLLKAKFTTYKDFHTMLYTCAVEFDFLEKESFLQLTKTLVLPLGCLVIGAIFVKIYQGRKKADATYGDTGVIYNVLQLIVFFVMAVLIMRLKLFFTPHLCLIVSLLMASKYFSLLDKPQIKGCVFACLLGMVAIQGIQNVQHQRNILGEFNNPELEELITWVNHTLPEDAVFAGPMPTMANLLLSTRRPIVNHPHYENAQLRERTRDVYTIFSRKSPMVAYAKLSKMKANFVIIERNWCYGKRREGCAMVDLWDIEDTQNKDKESLCQRLIRDPTPFQKVFENPMYTVLKL